MKYDIAAKRLLQAGKREILEQFLGIHPGSVRILRELPTETVSLRAADFPLFVRKRGETFIQVLELQTLWKEEKLLSLIEYRIRYKKHMPGRKSVPA